VVSVRALILCGEDSRTATLHVINDLASDGGRGYGYCAESLTRALWVRQVRADHPRICEACVKELEIRGLL
jgi:hypothetical protein